MVSQMQLYSVGLKLYTAEMMNIVAWQRARLLQAWSSVRVNFSYIPLS